MNFFCFLVVFFFEIKTDNDKLFKQFPSYLFLDITTFKKKVLEKVLPRLVEKKFAGDLELLIAADSIGFKRIYEAPIKLNYNLSPLTSAATLKAILGIFIDTLAIFYRKKLLRYYNRKK